MIRLVGAFAIVTSWTTAALLTANDRAIEFPDVQGYRTLAVDLHTHSVFSDGNVWPTIRVDESSRDALDLLAITEHLEYQPHAADIPHPDRNRSFALATEYGAEADIDLIIVNGAEITRRMPPGHLNAVFVTDANALIVDDAMDSLREAERQGAFVFWNHPSWTGQRRDGAAQLADIHRTIIDRRLMHGIEVATGDIYSAEALQIALDHELTILGVSDIHGLVDWDYAPHAGGHRTVTLVLAEERTAPSVREALMARRTIAWFNNSLIGREDVLLPLLRTSLTVTGAVYRERTEVIDVTLSNRSDVAFELQSTGRHRFYEHARIVRVPPHGEVVLGVTGEDRTRFELEFQVLNAITAPDTHAVLRFQVEVPDR